MTGVASLHKSRETIGDTKAVTLPVRGQNDKITERRTGNGCAKMATKPYIDVMYGPLVRIPPETC